MARAGFRRTRVRVLGLEGRSGRKRRDEPRSASERNSLQTCRAKRRPMQTLRITVEVTFSSPVSHEQEDIIAQ
jgi:hypothetical protein